MLTRRQFIKASGTAAIVAGTGASIAGCSGGSSSKGVVNVITWGDPQKAKLLGAAFKEETGITLNLVPGLDDADFWNKVRYSGPGTYDIVVTNIGWVPLYEKAGLIEVLDLSSFPAADELYPEFRSDMRFNYLKAPDRSLVFPDQWGLYGMTFSTITSYKVTRPYSWEQLWKAPKGTVILDGFYVVDMAMALRMTGLPWDKVFSATTADLNRAAQRLIDLKPFQMPASTTAQINAYRTKAVNIGMLYSLGLANNINTQVGKDIAVSVVPEEGCIGALDGIMLLKGARNRSNALKWINFMGGKRSQLIFWDLYKGPTANKAATEEIIARGGRDAALIKAQAGNDPEFAANMTEVQQPTNPAAWNLAWDRVTA